MSTDSTTPEELNDDFFEVQPSNYD